MCRASTRIYPTDWSLQAMPVWSCVAVCAVSSCSSRWAMCSWWYFLSRASLDWRRNVLKVALKLVLFVLCTVQVLIDSDNYSTGPISDPDRRLLDRWSPSPSSSWAGKTQTLKGNALASLRALIRTVHCSGGFRLFSCCNWSSKEGSGRTASNPSDSACCTWKSCKLFQSPEWTYAGNAK